MFYFLSSDQVPIICLWRRATYRPLLLYSRNNLPPKGYFSYPSNKTLAFHSRNKIVREISDPIQTEQVISCEHARLGHYPKKENQPVKAESAENGNQMAGNGSKVPKPKSFRGHPANATAGERVNTPSPTQRKEINSWRSVLLEAPLQVARWVFFFIQVG